MKIVEPIPGRVLGIDGGSRWIGWAVVEHGIPIYWNTIDCRTERESDRALRRRVRVAVGRLFDDLRPERVAIEAATNEKTGHMRKLKLVLREIETLADSRGIPSVYVSPKTARACVTGDGWADKEQVARYLAHRFPQMRSWLVPRKSAQIARFAHHSSDALCVALAACGE